MTIKWKKSIFDMTKEIDSEGEPCFAVRCRHTGRPIGWIVIGENDIWKFRIENTFARFSSDALIQISDFMAKLGRL